MSEKAKIGIVMGSDSDLPVMEDAAKVLKEFDVPFELTLVSAHRTPDRLSKYAKTARKRGLKVIIAGAGGAAHLPGMLASHTSLPVVGVPIKSHNSIQGIDSLLSIVQMPGGIPVATVAINAAKNAALLALRILSSSDAKLAGELDQYAQELEKKVHQKIDKVAKNYGSVEL